MLKIGNVVKCGKTLLIISRDYGSSYEAIDLNSGNVTHTIYKEDKHKYTKQIREDLDELEKDNVEYYLEFECRDVKDLPEKLLIDVPNVWHLDNVVFIADSVNNYVRKCLVKVFDGLEIDRRW
jgi:hypothetical protein